jgi:hypothetical protein
MGSVDNGNRDRHRLHLHITHDPSFRFFTNVLLMVVVNAVCALLYFCPSRFESDTKAEVQEQVAMALINNPYLTEEAAVFAAAEADVSDKGKYQKRVDQKRNICSMCEKKTIWFCTVCSKPKAHTPRTFGIAKGKGGNIAAGKEKSFITGYVHVCSKGTCWSDHACPEPGVHPSSNRKRSRKAGASDLSDDSADE